MKIEMTLKEAYVNVILNNYNVTRESIKLINVDACKKALVVNCIRSMQTILINAVKDDDITCADFQYLNLQVFDLCDELLKCIKDEYIFI